MNTADDDAGRAAFRGGAARMTSGMTKLAVPELSLVVLVGVTGSGKSTFARTHFKPTEVLSSDFCRGLVCDDDNDQAATKDAFEVLHFIAGKRLTAGRLTVVDATNVQAEARKELIALARDMRQAEQRGEQLGLTEDEVAFYDALEVNDSAVAVLGDETLRMIAQELVRAIRSNIGDAVNLLVHIERRQGRRVVTQVYEVQSYDPALDRYNLEQLFERNI